MIIAELLAELKDADQQFEAVMVGPAGTLVPIEDITPQIITLDGEKTFCYLIGPEQANPVDIEEMDDYLNRLGHNI